MSHIKRVERFIIVDILAGSCGAAAVAAVLQRSWLAVLLTLVIAAALWMLERETIEEEDEVEAHVRPSKENELEITDKTIAALRAYAARSFENSGDDPVTAYQNGLKDGVTMAAQYVLGEVREEAE